MSVPFPSSRNRDDQTRDEPGLQVFQNRFFPFKVLMGEVNKCVVMLGHGDTFNAINGQGKEIIDNIRDDDGNLFSLLLTKIAGKRVGLVLVFLCQFKHSFFGRRTDFMAVAKCFRDG